MQWPAQGVGNGIGLLCGQIVGFGTYCHPGIVHQEAFLT